MGYDYKLYFTVYEEMRPDYGDAVKDIITGYGSIRKSTDDQHWGSIEATGLQKIIEDYHDLASELESYWARIVITKVEVK